MKPAAIALAACLVAIAPAAAACGYCIEDKVAAVYDHAIVAQARAQAHTVVYLSLEFTGPVDGATAGKIVRAVERIASVDHGSVRVAVDAGSVSLAFDAKRAPPGAMVDAVERAVAPMGARTALLQFGNPAGT